MSLPMAKIAARILTGAPQRSYDQPLDRMLDLAQITPLCAVAVAGPEAAEAMCGLWRRGYERVECARRATCPAADEQCDLLMVAGCDRAEAAGRIVRDTRAMLTACGQVIIDAGRMSDPDERLKLCGLLAEAGFAIGPDAHLAPEILARPPVRTCGGLKVA